MMQEDSRQWLNIIIAPVLIFVIIFITGPVTILLAVLLQRTISRQSPPWDPDRYWDGIKGYAFVGALIYIALIIHLVTWNNQLGQVIQEGLALDIPALFSKWAAGLLLLPAITLLQEQTQPRTDRALMRIITPAEQQILTKRETKRQASTKQLQKQTPTKQIEVRDTPLDPAKLDKRTFWERVPDDAPMKQIAREEQARNQFLKDEAQRMGHQPSAPTSAPKKQDKGDGSMDELL